MKKKRIISVVLATTMITTALSSIALAYSDISGHWSESHIERLSSEQILKGYEDNTFAPDRHITREETAAVIDRVIEGRKVDIEDKNSSVELSDIDGRWSTENIKSLISKGIIDGYTDGTFKPEINITRQEAAKIISKILKSDAEGNEKIDFRDIEGQWGKEFIERLSELSLINGYGDGTFRPGDYITRAELAKIISETLNREKDLLKIKEETEKPSGPEKPSQPDKPGIDEPNNGNPDIGDNESEEDDTNSKVDYDKLEETINMGKGTDTTGKSKDSIDKLEKAIAKAEEILEKRRSSHETVNRAIAELEKAIADLKDNKLPVITASNKSIVIGDKVELLEGVSASDEEDGDLTFKIKVTGEVPKGEDGNANKVGEYTVKYSVTDSDGGTVEKSITVKVVSNDKSGLKELIEKAEKTDLSGKTKKTVNALKKAIEDAKKVNDNDNAKKNDIEKAVEDLNKALNDLKDNKLPEITASNKSTVIGDKVELLEGVSASDEEDGDLTSKIKVTGEVPKGEDGTANKVGEYTVKYSVTDSDDGTVERSITVKVAEADKVELISAIEKAKKLDKKNLTPESLERINTELVNAKKINEDVNSLPSQIILAIEALNSAVDSAEEVIQDGSIENPFRISTVEDLKNLKDSKATPEMHYVIINDIDMESIDWKPFAFDGSIDGKGFRIKNLTIKNILSENNNQKEIGLFTIYGKQNSEIKNLILESVNVDNSKEISGVLSTGGIAGKTNGKITNCLVSGVIKGGVAGGVAGYSYNDITKCGFIGTVLGEDNTGGISGYSNGSIYESFSKGLISSEKSYVGGIAGSAQNIRNSYASTLLRGKYIGGIAGSIETGIATSYSSSVIGSEYDRKGGLNGVSGGYGFVSIRDSYFDGDLFPVSSADATNERTTKEMKKGVSDNDIYKGWKEEIWDIAEGRYPKLRWEDADFQSEKKLNELLITNPINKKDYYVGEDINLEGLKVIGVYSNGDVEEIAVTLNNIEGFDSSEAADSQMVTVKVDGKTIKFDVKIWSDDIGLEGDGTQQNPYKISKGEEMKSIGKLINSVGKYFELANDIDMKGVEWKSIQFDGHFDGKGYKINNFTHSDNEQLVGLFSKIGSKDNLDASFVNTKFENSSVKNEYTGNVGYYNDTRNNTGTLTGESWGTISNVHIIDGKVENAKEHIGGITGDNRGKIEKSSFKGTISESLKNTVEMGGITARNFGTISEAYTEGKIIRDTTVSPICSVGGIAGKIENNSKITNSYSKMYISGRASVGGIAGGASAKAEIINSYFAGQISVGADYASAKGGIYAGWTKPVIKDSYYDKEVAGFTKPEDADLEKSTLDMKSGVPFENWDTSIWRFESKKYPEFAYQENIPAPLSKNAYIKSIEDRLDDVYRIVYNAKEGETNDFDEDPHIQLINVKKNGEFTNVSDLISAVESEDGSAQKYEVIKLKDDSVLDNNFVFTDLDEDSSLSILKVTSEDGSEIRKFYIHRFNRKLDKPVGVEAVNAKSAVSNDGKIINVNSDMQYKSINDLFYKDINSTVIPNLSIGVYEIRYAEKKGYDASDAVKIVIDVGSVVEGTVDNPIKINDAESLKKIQEVSADKYYELTADIDLSDVAWEPSEFEGHLDGKGFAIKNLKLNTDSPKDLGLISVLKSEAKIKNLFMKDIYITNNITSNLSLAGFGGIAAQTEAGSLISGCKATGSILGVTKDDSGEYLRGFYGGIVGVSRGDIENSYADVNVSSRANAGGVVGVLYGKMKNCYSISLTDSFTRKGTVLSVKNSAATIENSYYDKDIAGEYDWDVSALGTGLSTKEMKVEKSDKVYVDWDESIWKFKLGDYPKLHWEKDESDPNTQETGNTVSNTLNGGLVAEKDGYIYYSNSGDSNSLYRMKVDGTEKNKLNSLDSKNINIVGDKIYYLGGSGSYNRKIYKSNLDGSNIETIYPDTRPSSLSVIGDIIYIVDAKEYGVQYYETDYIVKGSTDGTKELVILSEEMSDNMCVVGEEIFYTVNFTSVTESNLKIVKNDNSEKREIGSTEGANKEFVSSMVTNGSTIYFADRNNGYNMYSMKIDGTELTKLNSDDSSYFALIQGYIYYKNGSDNQYCYRVKTDGTGRELVLAKNIVSFNEANGRIYFEDTKDSFNIYSMNYDGSDVKKVE